MASHPTLLSQRASGPPTDISQALTLLQRQLQPPSVFIPNLPSVLDVLGSRMTPPHSTSPHEHVYNSPARESSPPRSHSQAARQLPYSSAPLPSYISPTRSASSVVGRKKPMAVSRTAATGRPLASELASFRPARTPRQCGVDRGSGVRADDAAGRTTGVGTVSTSERTRCRNEVAKKLLDLHDEMSELCECREKIVHQVEEAMCVDPRRAKEARGVVSVLAEPPDDQKKALHLFLKALDDARKASVELVAAYLTPEEKRFLGINTHLFQTREERATTYQYAPPRPDSSARRKAKQSACEPTSAADASSEVSEVASTTHRSKTSGTSSVATRSSHQGQPVPSAHSGTQAQSQPTTNSVSAHQSSRQPSSAAASSQRSSRDRPTKTPENAPMSAALPQSSHGSSASSRRSQHVDPQVTVPAAPQGVGSTFSSGVVPAAAATEVSARVSPAVSASMYSSPAYSPAAGQQSVEGPLSPAAGAQPEPVWSAPPALAPPQFSVKQFNAASSTSTTEKDVTPERVFQPKLSASTLGGSPSDSPHSVGRVPQTTPAMPAPAPPVAAVPPASAAAPPPWTVSVAATGTTVSATPPPLPAAPRVANTRPEFKRFVIDSDSDSSLL